MEYRDFPQANCTSQQVEEHYPEDFMLNLNAEQKEAVLQVAGPVLILAGAGTGKTRTITARMGHIIKEGYAQPHEILAVTFTNKAAKEMLSRVNNIVTASGIWLGTFHAIAARILRSHAELVGLSSNFTIISPDDQLQIIKTIAADMQQGFPATECKGILHTIQRWKEKGLLPHDITETELQRSSNSFALRVYEEYQERLKALNCADFGDLLLHNVTILSANPDVLAHYQEHLRYVMVDEYQDINTIQYLWLRLLVRRHKNLCCVGDDDQSIYNWRGAEVGNILRFSDDFPDAKVIRLECNYRSTSNILAAASAIIDNNKSRLKKTLWTHNQAGQKVGLMKFFDGRLEAQYISEHIKSSYDYKFSETAVLVRASFQTRVFEEFFVRYGIPYKIIGGTKFYDRVEIRDLVAYLKVVVNPNNDIAFEKIINKPKRKLGTSTVNKLRSYGRKHSISLTEAGHSMIKDGLLSDNTSNILQDLLKQFDDWREMLSRDSSVNVLKAIAHDSGYIESLKKDGESGLSRIENIKELFSAVSGFDDVSKFLEHISLVAENDSLEEDNNYVHVMTLHAAKGLEFPLVFLPGWEEGVFPHEKSMNDITGNALEEERRLAYVGITRAREQLYISCAAMREINNWSQSMKMSRFIKELPREHVQVLHNMTGYA
ncbi:ATP-dependent helicase [Anaplasma phagocytophilum]|uniref:ATP-dependent helicase n=1 Tax=Anaplasma phagocytophilum TaxID=948 RepID=UPI0007DEAEE4|nr:UvrD-helicase domain-containing protein [Anaplasma phagocytophilum]SBO30120.1 ATP-dependent DNA helicase PcrA [Anaplasma phagocytophilum]SBO32183.1 ATP-dependent DNA helicase PcrA [Anaplasma phagocytophilum]SBO32380.1 ATP-dependent DNA helicase PcrA [Anaplasma phagocytophilum]SCV64205.1 ATP-dependent DNA helicase PcrA [Anaplasma phagocytophilum]